MSIQDLWSIADNLLQGAGQTLLVTFTCFITGMTTGLATACLQRLGLVWLSAPIYTVLYIYRGTPVYVLVFLVYFGLPSVGLQTTPLLAMNLSLGLVTGAYLAEVFRAALQTIEPGEIAAAQAMGMSKLNIFTHIEIPQMLRFSLPGIANEFTSTLKSSPFAYVIGINEITRQATAMSATSNLSLQIYATMAVLYFLIYLLCISLLHPVMRRVSANI